HVSLTRRELEALVLSGACDELMPLSAAAYPFVHARALAALANGIDPTALERLSGIVPWAVAPGHEGRLAIYRKLVRIRNELNYIQMHVSDHPMRVLRSEADRCGCIPTSAAVEVAFGTHVSVAVVVAAARRVRTRNGAIMQFATLEDEHGLLEAVLFPD